MHAEPYLYYYRKGYTYDRYLLEFVTGVALPSFQADLLNALTSIHPLVVETEELWMNDEVCYHIDSDLGPFTLSKDIWDQAFLMDASEGRCINSIHEILLEDQRFRCISKD